MYLKRKYQVGGIVYTPYLPAQAGSPQESTSTTTSGSSSKSSPDKITGTIKGEIVKILNENGIPTDVDTFLATADSFLKRSSHLSTSTLFGGTNDDYDLSDLIKVQKLANDVKYNNNLRNEAVKRLVDQQAGSEVAVTDRGLIYAQNENGDIVKLTPKDFADNQDKYNPLSNDQLLYMREHSPEMAFKTDILNDLHNAVGMDAITKYLRDVITKFGTDELGGYTTKDAEVDRGLKALMEKGPDGFYSFTDKEQLRDVNRALRYLYNGMPNNAKNLLRAKVAVEGGDPSDPNDVSNIILQALYEHTSREKSVKFDKPATEYDPNQTGKKGGSGTDSLTHDTYPEALVSGSGLNPARYINIMPQNTGVTLHAYSQNAGPVLKNEKDRMNTTNLQVVLTDAYGVSGVTNAQSVTFGDQLINPTDYKKVMVDGFTNMQRVYLPVKHAPDGRITPDFEAQQKLEQVQQYIANNNGAVSDAWINSWLEENLPEADWNPETKRVEFNSAYVMPFLVLHGVAAKNRVDFDSDSPYLYHLPRQEGKQLIDDYDRIVTEESVLGKLEHNKAKGAGRGKYYSGNIYIPISGPTTGSLIYNHQYFPKETYTDITQKATANQIRQQIKTNF